MYFISPVKYWARAHNGPIFDGLKSGHWQDDHSQLHTDTALSKLNVRTAAEIIFDLTPGGLWLLEWRIVMLGQVWSPVEDVESNERAETAIWPQEMVAHSGTLETLLTACSDLTKRTLIIYTE